MGFFKLLWVVGWLNFILLLVCKIGLEAAVAEGAPQSLEALSGFASQMAPETGSENSLPTVSNQVAALSVIIDSHREGWQSAAPYDQEPLGDNGGEGRIDWRAITMAHDCDDLYVRYQVNDGPSFEEAGYRYNLFIDVDQNSMTGYRGPGQWSSIGADVLIQGGPNRVTTYQFAGDDNQAVWSWQPIHFYPINELELAEGGSDIEFRIRKSDLNVFGKEVTSFNWLAWADYPAGTLDFFPDGGNLGDGGEFNRYAFTYTPKIEGFTNPERGFYEATQTQSSQYQSLDLATLQCYREIEGVSLIHRLFYLEDFVNADISEPYLEWVQADFDKIRQAGLKVIPRFAYSASAAGPNLTPPYGDASKERILSHLNQLSPILQDNSDVIAVMQAGFIGLWGEWWFSDHFQPDGSWHDRAEVLFKILDALPKTRMVQVRTPRYKRHLFNDFTPVDPLTGHDESNRSRTGHHNDCFVSSASDGGTYENTSEYPYLEAETQWLPMGGETCDPNLLTDPSPSRLQCLTVLTELSKFHWSYLNIDWYRPTLRKWLDDQCFTEIQQRLGYRFTLLQETNAAWVKAGESLNLSLQVKNEGFSAPFNPRRVELIMRRTDGSIYKYVLPDDPRFWLAGETHSISAQIPIPEDLPMGQYDLLLNLPDPEPSLSQRPEYSIRLANENRWEAKTGYNRLNHTVTVIPSVYSPESIEISVGTYDWGDLASLLAEDGKTYDIKSHLVATGSATDWHALTKISGITPEQISELTVSYRGQYSKKHVQQKFYLYNYKTTRWDLMDSRIVGNTDDAVIQVNLTEPEPYLSSSGETRVRVLGFKGKRRRFYSWANQLTWQIK